MEEELTRDLFNALEATIQFDLLQDQGAATDSLSGIVANWAERNFTKHLLVKRAVVDQLVDDMHNGRQVLLVGSNGGGKSCAALLVKNHLEQNLSHFEQPIDVIVFNGNHHNDSLQRLPSPEARENFIVDDICKRMDRRIVGVDGKWTDDFADYVTQTADAFYEFRTAYDFQAHEGRRECLARSEGARDAWHAAMSRFRTTEPTDRLRTYAHYQRDRNRRFALIIDNCDYLSNEELEAAAAAAAKLYTAGGISLPVIVSARPVTAHRAQDIMRIAFDQIRYVNLYDAITREYLDNGEVVRDSTMSEARFNQDMTDAYEIFRRRIDVLTNPRLLVSVRRWARRKYIGRGLDEAYHFILLQLSRLKDNAEIVLQNYFLFNQDRLVLDDDAPIYRFDKGAKEDVTRVFLMWHNGSLREIAISLIEFTLRQRSRDMFSPSTALRALTTSDSAIAMQQLAASGETALSERTVLFRHLFFHGTTRPDGTTRDEDLYPVMNRALSVFNEGPSAGAAISFLRARILQYLFTKRASGPQTVESISRALSRIAPVTGSLNEALQDLMLRPGCGSGLVRVDRLEVNHLGRQVLPAEFNDHLNVELLPAGALLVSRLIYVVEFLYWSVVSHDETRTTVCEQLGVGKRALVRHESLSLASFRLEVALGFVLHVVVPQLARDFPYTLSGRDPSDEEVLRLGLYAQTFGFGRGNWYLTRVLRQAQQFGSGRPSTTLDPDALRGTSVRAVELFAQLLQLSRQLDSAFDRLGTLNR